MRLNSEFANGGLARVTDGAFPSALREVRSNLVARPVIIGVLALGVILGISGPFDTLRQLSILPRVAYWILVVAMTFATGSFVGALVRRAPRRRTDWLWFGVSALAIGAAVTVVVSLINLAVFGVWPDTWFEFLQLFGVVTLISAVVELAGSALDGAGVTGDEDRPILLERLPLNKRGALVALSAEDHYVRVTTTVGEELLLMRLSDAVRETNGTSGLQIHRSHWVAIEQISEVRRVGDRGEVTLSDGSIRPISRGFMAAVREAGLLPKGRG